MIGVGRGGCLTVPGVSTIVPVMGTMASTMESSMAVALLPQTRRALLGLLYGLPDRAFYLREIAAQVGSGMGQVQRELGRLTRAGILRRFEQGRHVFYQADRRCPIFDELRGLVVKTVAGSDQLRRALAELEDRIVVAFVFGSVARGEDRAESDLELFVVGLDTCRRKRHKAVYERVGAISDAEADEMVAAAKRLREEVSEWIRERRPELLEEVDGPFP